MKKIVFVSLMMADSMNKRKYPVDGNAFIEYSGEVYYAINAVLAKTMKSGDASKDVLIKKGERIAQGIFMKYLPSDNGNSTENRTGGIGSTNK